MSVINSPRIGVMQPSQCNVANYKHPLFEGVQVQALYCCCCCCCNSGCGCFCLLLLKCFLAAVAAPAVVASPFFLCVFQHSTRKFHASMHLMHLRPIITHVLIILFVGCLLFCCLVVFANICLNIFQSRNIFFFCIFYRLLLLC